MDLATIIGLVGAFGMIVFAAVDGAGSIVGLFRILNLPSFAIVIVGSFFAVMVANKWSVAIGAFNVIKRTFSVPSFNEQAIINKLVAFSEKARREGLLALEDELEDLDDEFMKKGLRLVVDGTDATIIRDLLELELSQMQNRHASKIRIINMYSLLSPALGMLGTVMGLVGMLQNLEDKASIGPNMALALITTFYGSLFSQVVFMPLANKLTVFDSDESNIKEMVIEGILSIQSGDNTRILALKLLSYLEPVTRKVLEKELLKD
jgi:chemotaxis protein MotA